MFYYVGTLRSEVLCKMESRATYKDFTSIDQIVPRSYHTRPPPFFFLTQPKHFFFEMDFLFFAFLLWFKGLGVVSSIRE